MSMIVCRECGKKYSDTYHRCPFCEEEAALQKGKPIKRHHGHRVAKGGFDPTAIVVTLLIIVVIGGSGYFFFGDQIMDAFGIRIEEPKQDDPVVEPEDPEPKQDPDPEPVDPNKPETSVALDQTTLTLDNAMSGLTAQLTAKDGSGTYTWASSDPGVVVVSETGAVTAMATGVAKITVSDGYTNASCEVTVDISDRLNLYMTTIYSGGSAVTDVTMKAGDTLTFTVVGTTQPITFTVDNSNIATINSNGKVTAKKSGNTKIHAIVGNNDCYCLIRVK